MSLDKATLEDLRIDRGRAPKASYAPILIVVVLLLIVLAVAIIWWFKRSPALPVRTLVVQQTGSSGRDATLLHASGSVTARREATVSSKVTGKVIEVLVEEEMKVEAGQVLARIDSSNVAKSL